MEPNKLTQVNRATIIDTSVPQTDGKKTKTGKKNPDQPIPKLLEKNLAQDSKRGFHGFNFPTIDSSRLFKRHGKEKNVANGAGSNANNIQNLRRFACRKMNDTTYNDLIRLSNEKLGKGNGFTRSEIKAFRKLVKLSVFKNNPLADMSGESFRFLEKWRQLAMPLPMPSDDNDEELGAQESQGISILLPELPNNDDDLFASKSPERFMPFPKAPDNDKRVAWKAQEAAKAEFADKFVWGKALNEWISTMQETHDYDETLSLKAKESQCRGEYAKDRTTRTPNPHFLLNSGINFNDQERKILKLIAKAEFFPGKTNGEDVDNAPKKLLTAYGWASKMDQSAKDPTGKNRLALASSERFLKDAILKYCKQDPRYVDALLSLIETIPDQEETSGTTLVSLDDAYRDEEDSAENCKLETAEKPVESLIHIPHEDAAVSTIDILPNELRDVVDADKEALPNLANHDNPSALKQFLTEIYLELELNPKRTDATWTEYTHAGEQQLFDTPIYQLKPLNQVFNPITVLKHKGSIQSVWQKMLGKMIGGALNDSLKVQTFGGQGFAMVSGSTYMGREDILMAVNDIPGAFDQAPQNRGQDAAYFSTDGTNSVCTVGDGYGFDHGVDDQDGKLTSSYAGHLTKILAKAAAWLPYKPDNENGVTAWTGKIRAHIDRHHGIAMDKSIDRKKPLKEQYKETGCAAATTRVTPGKNGRWRVTGYNIGDTITFAYIPSTGKIITLGKATQILKDAGKNDFTGKRKYGAFPEKPADTIKHPVCFDEELPEEVVLVSATDGLLDALETLGLTEKHAADKDNMVSDTISQKLNTKLEEMLPNVEDRRNATKIAEALKSLTVKGATADHVNNVALDADSGAADGAGDDVLIMVQVPSERKRDNNKLDPKAEMFRYVKQISVKEGVAKKIGYDLEKMQRSLKKLQENPQPMPQQLNIDRLTLIEMQQNLIQVQADLEPLKTELKNLMDPLTEQEKWEVQSRQASPPNFLEIQQLLDEVKMEVDRLQPVEESVGEEKVAEEKVDQEKVTKNQANASMPKPFKSLFPKIRPSRNSTSQSSGR